jgi:hypothetical protein
MREILFLDVKFPLREKKENSLLVMRYLGINSVGVYFTNKQPLFLQKESGWLSRGYCKQ